MPEKRSHINVGDTLTIAAGTSVGIYTDAACTILATIYADDGVTPAANPVIVDANGEFSYRAANGTYFEKIGTEPAAELRFVDGPTQVQAEDIAGNSATLYSWSILRLKQFITAWWATIKTIAGFYDTRVDLSVVDGGTASLDCRAGNAFVVVAPDTGAGMDFTLTMTNAPAGSVVYQADIFITVGTNIPTPSLTGKGTNVTLPTLTASRTCVWVVTTINNGTSWQVNDAGKF